MKFNRLGSGTDRDTMFNTYISQDGQLRIYKALFNFDEEKKQYILKPNSNSSEVFSRFHGIFEGYPTGTLEYCIKQAQLYYTNIPTKKVPFSPDISFTVNISTFEDTHIVMKSQTHQGTVSLAFNVDQAQQLVKLFQDSINIIKYGIHRSDEPKI